MLSTMGLAIFSLGGFAVFVVGEYLEAYRLSLFGLLLMFYSFTSIMVEIAITLWNK